MPEQSREKMAERRIDYIFCPDGAAVTFERIRSSTIVFEKPSDRGIYPSDHFGVLTEFG
jgi:hypothetical protein